MLNKLIKIGLIMNSSQNWEIYLQFFTCAKNCLLIELHIVSSVSAQKLRCPSSTRLATSPARLSSARGISAQTHHYYLESSTNQLWQELTCLDVVHALVITGDSPSTRVMEDLSNLNRKLDFLGSQGSKRFFFNFDKEFFCGQFCFL